MKDNNYFVYEHITPDGMYYIGVTNKSREDGKVMVSITKGHPSNLTSNSMVGKTSNTKYFLATKPKKMPSKSKTSLLLQQQKMVFA